MDFHFLVMETSWKSNVEKEWHPAEGREGKVLGRGGNPLPTSPRSPDRPKVFNSSALRMASLDAIILLIVDYHGLGALVAVW